DSVEGITAGPNVTLQTSGGTSSMVVKTKRSQLNWMQSAYIVGTGVNAFSTSTNITGKLSTMLATAGRGGVSVPLQESLNDDDLGLVCAEPNNRIILRNNATKDPILNGKEEVYARLTKPGLVYLLSYFRNVAGIETAYSFATSTTIDFIVPYRFDADRLPIDALISAQAALLHPDMSNTRPLVRATMTVDQPGFTHGNWLPVIYNNELVDSDTTYNPITGEFTVPVELSDNYEINAGAQVNLGCTVLNLTVFVNNVVTRFLNDQRTPADTLLCIIGTCKLFLNAGDVVTIRLIQLNTTAANRSVLIDAGSSFLNITRCK
ncbi:MAG: hypothetical protein ACRCZS_27525, partial [Chroococcidiopsis sp.]